MADIKLRIEVNPNAEIEKLGTITNKVNDVGSNSNISNTSFTANINGVYNNVLNANKNGREMLSFANNGILKFNSDGYLSINGDTAGKLASETNPDMFVWGAVPATKQYSVKLTFSNATLLKDIIIYGDKIANQFPTKAIIDGEKTIYNDDAQWAISMDIESDTHTIEFVEWNRINYNACITNIMVSLRYLELDKSYIDNIESLSQSTSDASSIQYGILANSGSATIRDLDGELEDYIKDNVIDISNVPVQIFVNGNEVQSHITTDSDYSNDDKIISMQMSNKLNKLNQLTYNGKQLINQPLNAYELLKDVLLSLGDSDWYSEEQINSTLSKKIVYGNDNVEGSIKSYLESIIVPYPYLEKGSYWSTINKICELAQLQFITDNKDNITIINARPLVTSDEINNAIYIPKHYMINNLQETILLKNKYDGINISENSIVKTIVDNGNCGNVSSTNVSYTDSKNIGVIGKDAGSGYYYNMSLILYYKTFVFTIPARTNLGLYVAKNITKFSSIAKLTDGTTTDNIKSYTYYSNILNQKFTISLSDFESTVDPEKITNISYNPNNDTFTIEFVACVGNDGTFELKLNLSNEVVEQSSLESRASSMEFTFMGEQEQFSFKPIDVSTPNISQAKTIIELGNNELQQTGTMFGDIKITDLIKNNILSDYKNGIASASVDLFCGDFYSDNGKMQKDFRNGEILNIGDVVHFDNSKNIMKPKKYWKVTGRNFKYAGSPLISVELQEIIPNVAGLYNDEYYHELIYSWKDLIDNNLITINNNKLEAIDSSVIGYLKISQDINAIGNLSGNNLIGVDIPNSINTIDEYAFERSYRLKNVILGDGVYNIPKRCFYNCYNLEYINLENIKTIGNSAFYECSRLYTNIESENYIQLNNIETIGNNSFAGCIKIPRIKTGDKLISIGVGAFAACTRLISFESDSTLISYIQESVFDGCKNLNYVKFKNIKSIFDYAFNECVDLNVEGIEFGSNLESIGYGAFNGCTSLIMFTIINSVRAIDVLAFNGCTNLNRVYFENTEGWNVNTGTGNITIDVTNSTINATNLTSTYVGYLWYR